MPEIQNLNKLEFARKGSGISVKITHLKGIKIVRFSTNLHLI